MKTGIVLLVLLAIVLSLASMAAVMGGAFDTGPKLTLRQRVEQAAVAGSTWQQVADVKEPRRYRVVSRSSNSGQSGSMKFNRANFETEFNAGRMPDGFMFEYYFSNTEAIQVSFNGQGGVEGVTELMTMGHLLQGTTPQTP